MARILVVDDNLLIRTLLREILGGGGHEVVGEAHDGVQAEASVRRLLPDLVTLDLVMPVRGGLDSLPYLLEVDPRLPVVVCSASLDQRRVLAAMRGGATGFILKPFDRGSVISNVNAALQSGGRPGPASESGSQAALACVSLPGDLGGDQREFVRVDATLPIRVTPQDGRPLVTMTVDVSASGLRLSAGEFTVGTRLDFRLELGAGVAPIHGNAHVARVDIDARPALAFDTISAADHERLNAFIARRAASASRAAPP